jgi:hypothetical protein
MLKEGTRGLGIEHEGCKFNILLVRLGFAETSTSFYSNQFAACWQLRLPFF